MKLSVTHKRALYALARRNGTGVFDKSGVLISQGDRLGFMRSTWNKLKALDCVDFLHPNRVEINENGRFAIRGFTTDKSDVAYSDMTEG